MGIAQSVTTVGTTAVSLLAGVADATVALQSDVRRTVVLSNEGDVDVLLGGEDVTSSDYGYVLAPGGEVALDLVKRDVIYAVVASGSADVRALHMGV